MGFLLGAAGLVGTFLLGVLVSTVTDECKAWLLWIADRMIQRAVSKLPEHLQARYSEEWRSHLEEMPGEISKLISVLGFLWAGWRMANILSEQPSQSAEEPESHKSGSVLSIQIGDQLAEFKDEVVLCLSGNSNESYRLFIHPSDSGFGLVGYPVPLGIEVTPPEPIYGFQPSIEALTALLASRLALPMAQIEAIRQTAIAGSVQEVGGSRSPVIRIFQRSELELAGLTSKAKQM